MVRGQDSISEFVNIGALQERRHVEVQGGS